MSTENTSAKSERVLYFDLLNIAACFSVVALHCSGTVFNFREDPVWWCSMVIQALFHWAVPVFFMLTGATLLNYRDRYDTKTFFKKRVLRTVIPFLVWSLIMFAFRLFALHSLEWGGVSDLIHRILGGDVQNVYWFFFVLFGLYLCLPVLSLLARPENTRTLWYLIGLWVFFDAVRPLLSRFLHIDLAPGFEVPLVNEAVGYCVLGWLLHNNPLPKWARRVIYVAGALSVIVMVVGTWSLSHSIGKTDMMLAAYDSTSDILISTAVFLLFQNINRSFWERPRCRWLIRQASGASFGVYLFHMIPLDTLTVLWGVNMESIAFMLLGTIGLYLFCVVFVALCRRVPVLRHLFP